MTNFGLPFFLEDTTGKITGSDFVDLHNRMHLSLKQTLRDAHHTAYIIYDLSSRSGAGRGGLLVPLATLDFGPNNALGTVKIGDGNHVQMGHYLTKVAGLSRCVCHVFRPSSHRLTLLLYFSAAAVRSRGSSGRLMARNTVGHCRPMASGRYVCSLCRDALVFVADRVALWPSVQMPRPTTTSRRTA